MIAGFLRIASGGSQASGLQFRMRAESPAPMRLRPAAAIGSADLAARASRRRAFGFDDHEPDPGLGGQGVADPGRPRDDRRRGP